MAGRAEGNKSHVISLFDDRCILLIRAAVSGRSVGWSHNVLGGYLDF